MCSVLFDTILKRSLLLSPRGSQNMLFLLHSLEPCGQHVRTQKKQHARFRNSSVFNFYFSTGCRSSFPSLVVKFNVSLLYNRKGRTTVCIILRDIYESVPLFNTGRRLLYADETLSIRYFLVVCCPVFTHVLWDIPWTFHIVLLYVDDESSLDTFYSDFATSRLIRFYRAVE